MILKEIIINCRNSLRNTTAVLKLLTNQTCRMGLASSKFSTSNLSSPQAKMIQQLISENCVVVFSKTTCPYCTQTKQMLNGMRVPYRAIELNQHPDGAEMQNVLASMTDAKTVPRVFINGDCVGGASDMKNLYRNGQLIKLVEQCISK